MWLIVPAQQIGRVEVEAEKKVNTLTTDLQQTQVEAAKKEAELKTAREQIRMLTKEKGVAMRDNAASYEQSLQRETQVSTHTHTHTHTLCTNTSVYDSCASFCPIKVFVLQSSHTHTLTTHTHTPTVARAPGREADPGATERHCQQGEGEGDQRSGGTQEETGHHQNTKTEGRQGPQPDEAPQGQGRAGECVCVCVCVCVCECVCVCVCVCVCACV